MEKCENGLVTVKQEPVDNLQVGVFTMDLSMTFFDENFQCNCLLRCSYECIENIFKGHLFYVSRRLML